MPRKILVTCALPYANGSIHLGHLVEHIQTDIWVRFQKMRGHDCYFICADDTHGTAVMLTAEKEGISPEELIKQVHQEHLSDFSGFGIHFDFYGSTHSELTRQYACDIYNQLKATKLTRYQNIEQFYDASKGVFLPDRFIKGQCPKCSAVDQYGDSCEVCGSTYSPTDLVSPFSVLSGSKPDLRSSEHIFFKLSDDRCVHFLKNWLNQEQSIQKEVINKMQEWLGDDGKLRDWDISRDAPYFGFEIPGEKNKFFYVWLDAPVGYMGAFAEFCQKNQIQFDDFWAKDSQAELYHFIGKDILYFHTLFWPAMLHFSGHRTPTSVFAHGFLTINGQKMSKSRGTFITAKSYLDAGINPEFLRYYFSTKLNGTLEDIDLNLDDLASRINSDLVGKFVNIASRCAGFIHRLFQGELVFADEDKLKEKASALGDSIAQLYEQRSYAKAMREIMDFADEVNVLIADLAPWKKIKDPNSLDEVQQGCSEALHGFWVLSILLVPVLPEVAARVASFFGLDRTLKWSDLMLMPKRINAYEHLLQRLEVRHLTQLIRLSEEKLSAAGSPPNKKEITSFIDINDFSKIDLRIAKILKAAQVEGADKLLKLSLDVGELGQKIVFAGIRSAYNTEDLEGKLTLMVANLAPRKMRFGLSEGMVLAASGHETGLYLLSPDSGAQPGMKVK